MRRSKLLKASRFGDFLRSTLSWWRSATISASREASEEPDDHPPDQIEPIPHEPEHRPIRGFALVDRVYDKDKRWLRFLLAIRK